MHKMRRTAATLIASKKGVAAASEFLGHSGVEVTKRYIDPSKIPGNDATEILPMVTLAPARPSVASHVLVAAASHVDGARVERRPSEWLDDADRLYEIGFASQAASTARIAIERWLNWLVSASHCRLPKGQTVPDLIHSLEIKGALTKDQVREIKRHIHVAHKAAHGSFVEPERVTALLAYFRQIIQRKG
jgi:hypothetical protein